MKTNEILFTAAVNIKLATAANLVAYGATHGADADGCAAILSDLDEVAHSLLHCNPAKRAAWIAVRDAARFFAVVDPATDYANDPHGFKRQALCRAAAAFEAAGINFSAIHGACMGALLSS